MAPPPIDNQGEELRQRTRRHFTAAQGQGLTNTYVNREIDRFLDAVNFRCGLNQSSALCTMQLPIYEWQLKCDSMKY